VSIDKDLMQVLVENEIYIMPEGLVFKEDYQKLQTQDVIDICYGVAQSKFGYGSKNYNNQNVVIGNFENGIQILFAKSNTSVFINLLNLSIPLNAGELLIAKTDIGFKFNENNVISVIYGINFQEQFVGSGSKSYEVVCTIKDTYKIKVHANNEEEAIKIANETPIHSWKHPDIESDLLKSRVLVRMARWGDLVATEIGV